MRDTDDPRPGQNHYDLLQFLKMPMMPQSNARQPDFSVLLVDDSDEDRFALKRLLHRSETSRVFEIREADTGARCLALCRERMPDCILLDYTLGDTDGVSLLAELNAGRDPIGDPICPVVVITGIGTLGKVAVEAFKNGAQDYLTKEALTSEGVILAIENSAEKVRLRRELHASEARLRSSLDNMQDCFGVYSTVRGADGTIVDFRCDYVNQAACDSNRMVRDEQVGHRLAVKMLPARVSSDLFGEYRRVVETGEPLERIDFVYRGTAYGGKEGDPERAFDLRAWKMDDGFAASWREITERKREQQTSQQLAAVVETSEDFIGIASLTGQALYVNAAGRRLVGLSEALHARETCISDYFFPEDLSEVTRVIGATLETGTSSLETRFRHFITGEPIAVQWNTMAINDLGTGQPYALATVTRDIREQKRIASERAEIALRKQKVTEAVQRSLLLFPPPDAYPGITVQPFYRPASDDTLIGGDFFDLYAVSADLVALVVGDATGKGIEAAAYTAEFKFALRAYLCEHPGDLATAFRLLNNFVATNARIHEAHSNGTYVAMVVALVNARTGEVSCCCAGAERPLIRRAATGDVFEVGEFGPLLGAFEDAEYPVTHHQLETNDVIALTTDGVTESRRPRSVLPDGQVREGGLFGIEGVIDALRDEAADPNRTLADVEESVVDRALAWADGHQYDDMCLLLARHG